MQSGRPVQGQAVVQRVDTGQRRVVRPRAWEREEEGRERVWCEGEVVVKGFSKRVEESQERGSEKEIQVGAGWWPLLLPTAAPEKSPNLLAAFSEMASHPCDQPMQRGPRRSKL